MRAGTVPTKEQESRYEDASERQAAQAYDGMDVDSWPTTWRVTLWKLQLGRHTLGRL